MLRWFFLFLSIACFACSFAARSMVSLVLLWLLALVLFVLWAVAQYQAHAGDKRRTMSMPDPQEMQRLREAAAARGTAAQNQARQP